MANKSFASRTYRDEGVVLRTHKLGEADRIVILLTRNHGQVRAVAKGVRRTSSKFGARLEPFMVVDLQLSHGRSLDIVTQVQTKGAYGAGIAADYARYTAAAAVAETAERLTDVDGESANAHYHLVIGAMAALSRGVHPPELILDSYLLRALSTAGLGPVLHGLRPLRSARAAHARFRPRWAEPSVRRAGLRDQHRRQPETMLLLAALLSGDWEYADASGPQPRRESAGLVASYLQWHLERVVKSLQHVERV